MKKISQSKLTQNASETNKRNGIIQRFESMILLGGELEFSYDVGVNSNISKTQNPYALKS